MRQLKFRAFDNKNKKMIYAVSVFDSCAFKNNIHLPVLNGEADYFINQYSGFIDIKDKEIYDGDIVKGIFSLRTGTQSNGRGRNAYSVAVYSSVEVTGIIVFKEEFGCFYFETDFKQEYLTSFWRGCGRTKAERDANYLTITYDTPKNYLHKVYEKIEVIGNIYENSKLLNR